MLRFKKLLYWNWRSSQINVKVTVFKESVTIGNVDQRTKLLAIENMKSLIEDVFKEHFWS